MGVPGALTSLLWVASFVAAPPSVDAGAEECFSGGCSRPVPDDLKAQIADAERVGPLIFEQDEVSARATDVLYDRAPEATSAGKLRGWVTIPGPWWRVVFFVARGDDVAVGYELDYSADLPPERTRPTFRRIDPPREPDAEEAARFRAVRTAIAALSAARSACGRNVNPVVLPGSTLSKKGWLVYLLASTQEQGTVVQGGHQRFGISEDGRTVTSSDQLSRCSTQKVVKEMVGIGVSTPFYDAPNEGHVFTALSTRLAFYLNTSRGTWSIKGARIRFFEQVQKADAGR